MTRKVPSTRRIVTRMLLTLIVLAGLIVCWFSCEQRTFLILFIVVGALYIAATLFEVHRSHGNQPRWGRQDPEP